MILKIPTVPEKDTNPFVCDNCNKEFGFKSVLRKHSYSCSKQSDNGKIGRSTLGPSPLTEYCEGLRSVKKAIEYLDPEIADATPSRPQSQYYQLISKILATGPESLSDIIGYEMQHEERCSHPISEYRSKYGNGDWITDYQCIDVAPLKPEVQALLSDQNIHETEHLVAPLTPNTKFPVPVLVSSEERLQDAISILGDLPLDPAASPDEKNRSERFPVETVYQEIVSRNEVGRIRINESSLTRAGSSTATEAAYKNDFRRFALIHTGSAATVPETIVVAFGVELPSGAAVVEWLEDRNNSLKTSQNGLAIKPGPDGIEDLQEVDLQSDFAEIVYIDH